MPEMRLRLGLCPRPRWRSCAPPNPLAGFKGPTSKGRGRKEGGRDVREGGGKGRGEGEGKGRKEEGREGSEGGLTPTFLYSPLPLHTIQTVRIFILEFQIDCPLHQLDFIHVLVRHSI